MEHPDTPRGGPTRELDEELERRVVYATLVPAVRLGRLFGVHLREASEWLELAHLKELVDEGVKLKEAAEFLHVSVRKVSMLSSRLRENFFVPEREHELPSRILFALWAEPLSRKRIKQYLSGFEEGEIDEAVDRLERDGKIRLLSGRTPTYEVIEAAQRLVRRDMMARVDALDSMLSTVTDAIYSRFFSSSPEASFARALQLRVSPKDLPKLRALYEEQIWPTLSALDEAARDDPDALPLGVALSWAPLDATRDALRADSEE
jgi:hypothetical protein